MFIYAHINKENICDGISTLAGEVIQGDLIAITDADSALIYKKYDLVTKTWSTEGYEPASTAPIDAFTALQNQMVEAQSAINYLVMGGTQ
jgi:hypothetical protein